MQINKKNVNNNNKSLACYAHRSKYQDTDPNRVKDSMYIM